MTSSPSSKIINLIAQMEEEMNAQEQQIKDLEAKLESATKRCAELETKLSTPKKEERIRGQTEGQMVAAIAIIARSCPELELGQIRLLWRAHAHQVAQEEAAAAAANKDALAVCLEDWLKGGMHQRKRLCGCLEWDCPSEQLVYSLDHGFIHKSHAEAAE